MFNWNGEEKEYSEKEKLPSGQTIEICFQESQCNGMFYYNIALETYHKRKQKDSLFNKQTGKDGLQGLIWAKKKILEFEEYIKSPNHPVVIYCTWTNNKRRNVYEWGLKKIGYGIKYLTNEHGTGFKALCKEV